MPKTNLIRTNSVARALAIIGDRWSLLILGGAFQGMRRFGDWRGRIGIASNILTNRLERLVKAGCLKKVKVEDGRWHEYRLTQMGAELYPTALMFWRFDRLWSDRGNLQLAALSHVSCCDDVHPELVCGHCRRPVRSHDVRYEDGPGAGFEKMPPPKLSRRSAVAPAPGECRQTLFGESVDVLGDRWTQLVLASFFLGARRFDEILGQWKIATNILAGRLKTSVQAGLLQRRLYQRGPDRYEYLLTPKGMDIYPIVLALTKWGDRWLAAKAGRPLVLYHKPCGQVLDPIVVCDRCARELQPHEVSIRSRD